MAREEAQQDALATQQPLGDTQIHQYREYVEEHGRQNWTWESIPEGSESERTWERTYTVDTSYWYTDTVEDYSSWYETGVAVDPDDPKGASPQANSESPFGGPIVPPMLIMYLSAEHLRRLNMKGGVIMITFHESEIVRPVLAGTRLRYTARISKKFVKRGRHYLGTDVEVADAATGEVVLRDYREMLMDYRKTETDE